MYEGKAMKSKLQAGDICLGTWISFTDPTVAELLSESGFDFFIIDSEHSALGIEAVQLNVMATKGTSVSPIVRVACNDPVLIKRVLDVGAGGVLLPMTCSAEDVRRGVAACMYPPEGIRGFGPRRPASYQRYFSEYIQSANDNIVVWAQIEHIEAVENIDSILQVPGLSGVFVGAYDLSGSMGIMGQTDHPDVLAAIERVITAGRSFGLPVGIAGPADPNAAADWVRKGVQFITVGGDQGFLVQASEAAVCGVRERLKVRET